MRYIALLAVSMAAASPASAQQIVWDVFSSAGGPSTSSQWSVRGTLGQGSPVGLMSGSGWTLISGFTPITRSISVSVPDQAIAAEGPRLRATGPNPFGPETSLRFELDRAGHAVLEIVDISGRRVRTLADARYESGAHDIRWDGTNEQSRHVSSGTYFATLRTETTVLTVKMVLIH